MLHKCDNKKCVNPEHLFLGTQKENVHDMHQKNRNQDITGEKNPGHKLTKEQVNEIRYKYAKGVLQREIGKEYGILQNAVSRIVNYKRWS